MVQLHEHAIEIISKFLSYRIYWPGIFFILKDVNIDVGQFVIINVLVLFSRIGKKEAIQVPLSQYFSHYRVLQLMNLVDSRIAQYACEKLDLAILSFFEQFRKIYVGDQVPKMSKVRYRFCHFINLFFFFIRNNV